MKGDFISYFSYEIVNWNSKDKNKTTTKAIKKKERNVENKC